MVIFGFVIVVLKSSYFYANICNRLSEIYRLYNKDFDCNPERIRGSSVDF